jgi:hypothetical protein
MCGLTPVTVPALWSCSLPKYLERWPAALLSVLMLMKGSKISRIKLNTVHLYQHYSLFMHDKLQYTCRGDYCKCVQPAQVPVLNEVRAPSLLEKHPRYVPHRDRARHNSTVLPVKSETPRLSKYSFHEIICDVLEKSAASFIMVWVHCKYWHSSKLIINFGTS